MNQKRERAKNLTDDDIEIIVEIFDGWEGKLTWNKLIQEIELRLKEQYTRQTLAKHTRIKSAYNLTKERLSDTPKHKKTGAVEYAIVVQENERFKAENIRLKKENTDLLTQFARWAYNTYAKGVTKAELDKPLPKVD